MKVIKFGGTSVGSASSILSVKRIVETINEPLIVVVSALGGITFRIYSCDLTVCGVCFVPMPAR